MNENFVIAEIPKNDKDNFTYLVMDWRKLEHKFLLHYHIVLIQM